MLSHKLYKIQKYPRNALRKRFVSRVKYTQTESIQKLFFESIPFYFFPILKEDNFILRLIVGRR